MPIAYCMSAYPNQEINFARLLMNWGVGRINKNNLLTTDN
ncbi:hypothetical protein N0824_02936 [Microcystis sp. 0824]|nr:hypothetical protein N0824_02936 [Microcystis sp. 0824]